MAIITLNNNSISNITSLPTGVGGKVLQVVQSTYTSSFSTTSTSLTSTGYSATITPSSTSSKILAITNFSPYHGATIQSHYTWDRNGTKLDSGSTAMVTMYAQTNIIAPTSLSFLDSPSSTSALTYTLFAKVNTSTLQLTSQGDETTIQLMEIAG